MKDPAICTDREELIDILVTDTIPRLREQIIDLQKQINTSNHKLIIANQRIDRLWMLEIRKMNISERMKLAVKLFRGR